jgi:AAA domain
MQAPNHSYQVRLRSGRTIEVSAPTQPVVRNGTLEVTAGQHGTVARLGGADVVPGSARLTGARPSVEGRRRTHFEPELDFLEQLLKKSPLLMLADIRVKGDASQIPIEYEPGTQEPWKNAGDRKRASKRQKGLREELERYRFYTVDDLDELPPVEFLSSTPLAARELTGLYGKGDTYKSFLALGWACGLAARGHHVVYIAAEGGSGLRARIRAWMQHHTADALPTLHVMPTNVNLHDEAAVTDWLEAAALQLKPKRPVLVVVDTLARNFVGGSEKDAKDMGLFVEGCERVRRQLKCAVLVIHHTTKDGDSERGTESLRNASFAMFKTCNKHGFSICLHCDRMKEVAAPAPQKLTLRKVEFRERVGDLSSSLVLDVEIVERADLLRATERVLEEQGPLSANSVLLQVRRLGVTVRTADGKRLLKQYAEDSNIRVGRNGSGKLELVP